jgi:hypothetical protein
LKTFVRDSREQKFFFGHERAVTVLSQSQNVTSALRKSPRVPHDEAQ